LEDYSLRYAPKSFRRWTPYVVATTALGVIAYLADFAIGGSIAISNGFSSAMVAILAAAVVIFLTGIPISSYSPRYSIDMDLLTRGAGQQVHVDGVPGRVVRDRDAGEEDDHRRGQDRHHGAGEAVRDGDRTADGEVREVGDDAQGR